MNLIWPGEGKGVGEGVAARRDLATRTERGEYDVEEKAKLACKAMLPTFLLRTEEQSGVAAQGTRQPKYARRRLRKLPHMNARKLLKSENKELIVKCLEKSHQNK